jgi:hypothetical protein
VYTHISIIGLIEALVKAQTVVYPAVSMTFVCLSLFMSVLLFVGILTERSVLMLPAMIITVCAGECCGIAQ